MMPDPLHPALVHLPIAFAVLAPFFAAALALAGSEYACDYVGHMPAAKGYGHLRMYRLRAPVPATLRVRPPGSRSPA